MSKKTVHQLGLQIVETLFHAGFTAYFAGGWVRDRLLGKISDEIDIATNAPPSTIQTLFPKTIPVGVAFGVIIVLLEGIQFEISTFRKDHPYVDGRHPQGVDFSTPEKDALRRDFTINGLFYDPMTDTIHDYVGGKKDLEKQIIRAIGDPHERFTEDRLRMIRAVRFSARFGFPIEQKTEEAIQVHASTLLPAVSMERIWQEFGKMSAYPHFDEAILTMHRLGLLSAIFPALSQVPHDEMKRRTTPFPYFPIQCPPILFIMELFPHISLEERFKICLHLKTTRKDMELVEFFAHSQTLFQKTSEPVAWAHFYADPRSTLFLQVQAAHLEPLLRLPFHEEHAAQQKILAPHIERIQKKRPLISAHWIQKQGIPPGKQMGRLLKEAERIAVNENLHDSRAVLNLLKNSPLWPK